MDDAAVARRIALARLGRGWTQKELGEKLGRTKASATMLETGRGVSSEMLKEVADALRVSYGFLSAGIAQEADIEVIVEGARQDGWDEAVARMRESMEALKRAPRRRPTPPPRVSRPDEEVVLPDPAKHPKRKRA